MKRYTRSDVAELAEQSPADVRRVLRTFDPAGLSVDEHAAAMIPLLRVESADSATGAATLAASLRPILAANAPDIAPASDEALAVADDALQHRFTFYGETHPLPASINWDHNPGTAHWGHDLNRFSYLAPLMAATVRTGDAAYMRKALELIGAWVDDCDITRCFAGTPYAFGSYLNNAIHLTSWAQVLTLATRDKLVADHDLLRILRSVHEQIAYLEIVTDGHGGNWPTIGCQGILNALARLPVLADHDRFVDHCIGTFASQIDDQILPDGVQDELTPHYHSVVINNLLSAMDSLQSLDRSLEPRTLETLRKMLHYEAQATLPGGGQQLAFNDSDPERVPRRGDSLARFGLADALPDDPGPELFPWAGVAFLRQHASAGDLYLAFDGGPFGRSHQHEDKLGFVLHAYGRTLLVDPGRHLYDQTAVSYLPYLRSTQAHSTILVDGQGQHSKAHPDTWVCREPLDLAFRTSPTDTRASASYNLGYGQDNAVDVVHHRQIVFVDQRFWVVFDRVEGTGEHHLESRFQFAPGDVQLFGETAVTSFPDANLLLLAPGWTDRRVDVGCQDPRSGWYSASYNRIEPSPTLVLGTQAKLPWRSTTVLYPFVGRQPPEVTVDNIDVGVHLTIDGETRIVRFT